MKSIKIKFRPKTIARNELHFEIQKKVKGAIHKDKTKYDRKKNKKTIDKDLEMWYNNIKEKEKEKKNE